MEGQIWVGTVLFCLFAQGNLWQRGVLTAKEIRPMVQFAWV